MLDLFAKLGAITSTVGTVIDMQPVGSRVTCNPPPTDTDEDILVLIGPGLLEDFLNGLPHDYTHDGSDPGDEQNDVFHDDRSSFTSPFKSYSMDVGHRINLIVTEDREFFRRFMAASSVSKRLNLLDKRDRIVLFQAVLYGNQSAEG